MFTVFNNLFAAPTRHTENSDTRQEIKRHDPDQKNRKNKKGDKEEESQEGPTTVSIEALRVFLKNFLSTLENPGEDQNTTKELRRNTDTQTERSEQQSDMFTAAQNKPSQNGQAARAAQMYATMSHAIEDQKKAHILADSTLDQGPEISLDPREIRSVHQLMDDLKILSENGVEYLQIERAESFVKSLTNAVEIIKQFKNL